MMDHFGEPSSVPQPSPVVAVAAAPDPNNNVEGNSQEDWGVNTAFAGTSFGEEEADINRRPSMVRLLLKNSVVHFEEETEGAPSSLAEMCRQRSQSDMTANKTDASVLIGEYDPATQELQYVNPYRIDDAFGNDGGFNLGPFPSYLPGASRRKPQHQPGLEGIEEVNDDDEEEEGLLGSCPSPEPASASMLAQLGGLLVSSPFGATVQDTPSTCVPESLPAQLFGASGPYSHVDLPQQQQQEEQQEESTSPQKKLQASQKGVSSGPRSNTQQPVRKGGGPIRHNRETTPHEGPNTTVMFRNIPNRFSPEALREVIRDKGFAMSMDFFYMPMDFQNQCNLGYAFINFVNVEELEKFSREFHGQKLPLYKSHKVCEVCPARVQGLKANVDHFRKSAARGTIPDEYKPVCFRNGLMVPFPPPERSSHRTSVSSGSGYGEDHRRTSKSSTYSTGSSGRGDNRASGMRVES